MKTKTRIFCLSIFAFLVLFVDLVNAQNVLAVSDLVNSKTLSKKETIALSEQIRTTVKSDQRWILLDKALTDQILAAQYIASFKPCSTLSCLVDYGNYLYAQITIGGYANKTQNSIVLSLLLVDVVNKKILKSTTSRMSAIPSMQQSQALAAMVKNLLETSISLASPNVAIIPPSIKPSAKTSGKIDRGAADTQRESTTNTSEKKQLMQSSIAWIGATAVVVGGFTAYFLAKKSVGEGTPTDISIDNAPIHQK